MSNMERPPLSTIIGEQLSAVTFVMDYLQLSFNDAVLTTYTHPIVQSRGASLTWGDVGYRDAICNCITKRVRAASVRIHDRISIEFEDDTAFIISLQEDKYSGPEAAMFTYHDDITNEAVWDVW